MVGKSIVSIWQQAIIGMAGVSATFPIPDKSLAKMILFCTMKVPPIFKS